MKKLLSKIQTIIVDRQTKFYHEVILSFAIFEKSPIKKKKNITWFLKIRLELVFCKLNFLK